jgi:glycosyltransferase involved in cell wall biosynthesis
MALTRPPSFKVSVIVCAHNEARYLPACLHSILAQSRIPDEVLVINNASTDETSLVASRIPGVRVVDEPRKGLVVARETARRCATGDRAA